MRSLKDIALPAVGRGPAGKVSLSADSVPPNIEYGFQRYFVAKMKLEDRRPARTIQGMPPRRFSDGSEAQLSREGLHHRDQRRAKEIEGSIVSPLETELRDGGVLGNNRVPP